MKGCEHCEDSANKIAELEIQLEEMSASASRTQEQLDEMGKRRRKSEGRMLELRSVCRAATSALRTNGSI